MVCFTSRRGVDIWEKSCRDYHFPERLTNCMVTYWLFISFSVIRNVLFFSLIFSECLVQISWEALCVPPRMVITNTWRDDDVTLCSGISANDLVVGMDWTEEKLWSIQNEVGCEKSKLSILGLVDKNVAMQFLWLIVFVVASLVLYCIWS